MKPEATIRWLLTGVLCAVLFVLVLEQLSGSLSDSSFWDSSGRADRPSSDDVRIDRQPEIPRPVLDRLFEETRGTLRNYQARDRKAAQETLQEIDQIFGDYRAHVPAFVADVYSLNGKWQTFKRFFKDRYSGWIKHERTDRVEQFVRSVWTRHFGDAEALERELVQALGSLAATLEAHRNTMLVEISGHLDDLQRYGEFDLELDREAFEKRLMEGTVEAAKQSAGIGMTAEMASLAGGELSAYTLLRLLRASVRGSVTALSTTTAGSVAAGSSATGGGLLMSGWTTFGVGLVVGVLVDYGVTKHAKARMEARLEQALLRMQMRVMQGDGKNRGLSARIRQAFERYEDRKGQAVQAELAQVVGLDGVDVTVNESGAGSLERRGGS